MDEKSLIGQLRHKFQEVYRLSPHLFDDQVVQKVMNNDFTVVRYLWHNSMDVLSSQRMLIESMKWRKEFGINRLSDNYFPKQFFRCGAVFQYEPDVNGFTTLYIRIRMIKKIPELKTTCKQFLAHTINKVDAEANGKGWVLVVDASGAGLANCDLDLTVFLITTLNNYFPAAIQYIVVHAVPFALATFWKVIKSLIPSERLDMIRFTNDKDIDKFIPVESLPDFMGGKATNNYRKVPEDSPDGLQFGTNTLALPIKRVRKIVAAYEEYLEDVKN